MLNQALNSRNRTLDLSQIKPQTPEIYPQTSPNRTFKLPNIAKTKKKPAGNACKDSTLKKGSEVGDSRFRGFEVGGPRVEVGGSRVEVAGFKVRGQRSKVQSFEVRGFKVRGLEVLRTEVRGWRFQGFDVSKFGGFEEPRFQVSRLEVSRF